MLRVCCRCGHHGSKQIGRLSLRGGLSTQQRLWELVERLRDGESAGPAPIIAANHHLFFAVAKGRCVFVGESPGRDL